MDEELVTLLDENNEEATFYHVLTFEYAGARYVALEPYSENADDDDEAEIVIMAIEEQDGGDVYLPVENEVLLSEAFDHFLELMDELDAEADAADAEDEADADEDDGDDK